MSEPLQARYDFLSHYRRGAAADLANADPLQGSLPSRGALDVHVKLRSTAGTETRDDTTHTPVSLLGPGDIVGIDARHVLRTEPREGTMNYEPNYFAGIEFDHPEFPWLFTPAAPNVDRLRPWIALIVLADDEFTDSKRAPDPLPAIEVPSSAVLPDLADSWGWAHVQATGGVDGTNVEALQTSEPGRVLSRLLCPRRLAPLTRYTAFLVPAFDLGVKAGLKQDASGPQAQPAWDPAAAAAITLPVYHRFSFHTSAEGDFETLVRALVPRVFPPEVGMRPMAVDRPGWGMPSAGPPLGLGGALRSVQTQDSVWADPDKTAFQTALAAELNRAATPLDDPVDDPVVEPPIYGRWHAARATMDPTAPGWLDELNSDPRSRATGGMGARVVVEQRDQLMHAAWEQVDGIERANQLIRQAQLAQGSSSLVLRKHFEPASAAMLLTVTQPLHARMLASPRTVAATLAPSAVPLRALSPAFRRAIRGRGALRRRQGAAGVASGEVIARLNAGEITSLPPYRAPDGMVALGASPGGEPALDAGPGVLRALLRRLVAWLGPVLALGLVVLLGVALLGLGIATGGVVWFVLLATVLALSAAGSALALSGSSSSPPADAVGGGLSDADLTPEAFAAAPPRPDFQVVEPGIVQPAENWPGPQIAGASDDPAAEAFRAAAGRLAAVLVAPRTDDPVRAPAALGRLARTVLTRLDPATTVPQRVDARIALAAGLAHVVWEPDRLEEIMAAPEFPQPMYEPLRDLDQELLLPGLKLIPKETVGLVLENRRFLEGYMVGLNHEMARQLLWHGFPTDQRGSPFRQFWDVRGYVPTPEDPTDPDALREWLKDVKPVHLWPLDHALGHNPSRVSDREGLVLLVRGELLRRYPNTIVYACQATWNPHTNRHDIPDPEVHRNPQFRGTLPPDITFFGFDLTVEEARGDRHDRTQPQGWFFVFQEQPSEPRFGLEPAQEPFAQPAVTEWNDLTWGHLAADADGFAQLRYARASAPLHGAVVPATNPNGENPGDVDNHWGADAAQIAFITMRRPVRVAIHAEMMLPRA